MIKPLNEIKFRGSFRDYQQKILDNAQHHLKDGHIHIVAAPGSGKTILGLELICRLGKPTLILSPSVTIKQQWGERFEDCFISKEISPQYISYSLKEPSIITSITYQALHAAFNQKTIDSSEAEDEFACESADDFSDFNLMETIKSLGIKTVCLDEAHHLQNEWQKALEGFLNKLEADVKIIALTATPPYDGSPAEWNRYIAVCNEIDEEIFVPQLVAQKSLCPHQDFIYFNYPTEEEIQVLNVHRKNAIETSAAIIDSDFLKRAYESIENNDSIYSSIKNSQNFATFFSALKASGYPVSGSKVSLITGTSSLPDFNLSVAQTAFQFILDNPDIFSEPISNELREKLLEKALVEQRKVCLVESDKINRMLLSSVGKLKSICDIVTAEVNNLGSNLRMLILTDYIKKDILSSVGTQEQITTLGTVPIFEEVRRICNSDTKTAVLSGSLVIIPNDSIDTICSIAEKLNISCSTKPIENTIHSIATFSGSNKNKVSIITEAFQLGAINILIGTKSLLGEGWDSPCINSLILASFVGSFMLSNQMRGRAIRIDKNVPDKCANIWHLTTIEPPFDKSSYSLENSKGALLFDKEVKHDKILGNDFNTLSRRFDCFLAPAYNRSIIESGISRIDILKPPFDEQGISKINEETIKISSDRVATANRWAEILEHSIYDDIIRVNEIPCACLPKGLLKSAIIKEILLVILTIILFLLISSISSKILLVILYVITIPVLLTLLGIGLSKIIKHSKPEKTVAAIAKSLLRTLRETKQIESRKTKIIVHRENKESNIFCALSLATEHEKKNFSKAMTEMLSPFDEPRYLFVKQSRLLFLKWISYGNYLVCPSILATKKETAELLSKRLKSAVWKSMSLYTKGDKGTQIILKCRKETKRSLTAFVQNKKIVNPGWKTSN